MIDLSNKVALVAGSEGLIGSEVVRTLRRECKYVITVDVKPSADYFKGITNYTHDHDISKVGVFVNAAYPAGISDHLQTFYYSSVSVADSMKRGKGGVIINLSSIYGVVGATPSLYRDTAMGMPVGYSFLKAGIIGLTRAIASEFGPHGVRANCICPGGVELDQPEVFKERYCRRVPLGRMAQPADIADAVLMLCKCEYITGQAIIVDGGYTIR